MTKCLINSRIRVIMSGRLITLKVNISIIYTFSGQSIGLSFILNLKQINITKHYLNSIKKLKHRFKNSKKTLRKNISLTIIH